MTTTPNYGDVMRELKELRKDKPKAPELPPPKYPVKKKGKR